MNASLFGRTRTLFGVAMVVALFSVVLTPGMAEASGGFGGLVLPDDYAWVDEDGSGYRFFSNGNVEMVSKEIFGDNYEITTTTQKLKSATGGKMTIAFEGRDMSAPFSISGDVLTMNEIKYTKTKIK